MSDTTKIKFSTTIIAITGLITAIGGALTMLHNIGVLGVKEIKNEKQQVIHKTLQNTSLKVKEIDSRLIALITLEITKEEKSYDLTGNWWNKENSSSRYYINYKDTGKISFIEYSLLYDKWISTATGLGSIYKNNIEILYTTYLGTTGKFTAIVVNQGKELHGTIHNYNTGIKVVLQLIKEK